MLFEQLAKPLANDFTLKVVSSVLLNLQKQPTYILSDDAGLKNCWDEICVITQEGDSSYTEIIESTIDDLVAQKIKALRPDTAVLCAVWMQTYDGQDWLADNEDNQNAELTHNLADIVEYIRDEVLNKAMNWSNKRIERYSDMPFEFDDGYGY